MIRHNQFVHKSKSSPNISTCIQNDEFVLSIVTYWGFVYLLLSFCFYTLEPQHPWESPWHQTPFSAGVSGGKVEKLPALWRGRGRAAESSLHPEPSDRLWGHSSKVRHQKWRALLPWERRHWQDPRQQVGSGVPAQRQGWSGSKLRCSSAGLCWRHRPAGC